MSLRDQLLTADTPAEIAEVLDQYVRNEIVRIQTNPTTGAPELLGPDGGVLIRPVISYTWANRPAAADNTGVTIRITDVGGSAGSRWISDGTYWKPEGGRVILAHSPTPVVCPVSTAEEVLATIVVPAYSMGTTGRIEVETTWTLEGTNNKTLRAKLSSMSFMGVVVTTSTLAHYIATAQNVDSLAAQKSGTSGGNGSFGSVSASLVTATVNTATNQNITISGQKAVDSETIQLESYRVELIHP